MSVFSAMDFDHHEQVVFCHDEATGLKAIIAIHDTTLGPALGGCRMWNYASEQEAITDALRLSRGMTYKAAISDLPLGGGKAVIIGNSKTDKTPALLQAFGRHVDHLGGRYITAEDVGTSVSDMAEINKMTTHVTGLPDGCGDPSPLTAYGVYQGIKASASHKLGKDSLKGLKVAVQGLGHVGMYLCEYLAKDGVVLYVTDIDQGRIQNTVHNFKAIPVALDKIHSLDVDVFAPCALGAIINAETIPQLQCSIIAGGANNQLAIPADGEALMQRGILYAPDYVINAGGLICVQLAKNPFDEADIKQKVDRIHGTLLDIFTRADYEKTPTSDAADHIAKEKLQQPHHPSKKACS